MINHKSFLHWLVFGIICCFFVWFQIKDLWSASYKGTDITYIYEHSREIENGQNPYARILDSGMFLNDKYDTTFPLFTEISALSIRMGLAELEPWLDFWRWVFLIFDLGIAGVFFLIFQDAGKWLVGLGVVLFWFLNRWTLFVNQGWTIDILPIFFLVLSIYFLTRRRWLALIFFSFSLAFKQIGIFLAPLFIIEIWNTCDRKQRLRETIIAAIIIGSVSLLAALPFLIMNLKAFVLSMLFSAHRDQWQIMDYPKSFDMVLGETGYSARIPMLFLMGVFYLSAFLKQSSFRLSACLVMFTFIGLNGILFSQYFPWALAIIPFVAIDLIAKNHDPLKPAPTS